MTSVWTGIDAGVVEFVAAHEVVNVVTLAVVLVAGQKDQILGSVNVVCVVHVLLCQQARRSPPRPQPGVRSGRRRTLLRLARAATAACGAWPLRARARARVGRNSALPCRVTRRHTAPSRSLMRVFRTECQAKISAKFSSDTSGGSAASASSMVSRLRDVEGRKVRERRELAHGQLGTSKRKHS